MPKIMDPILPILSILRYWAIILYCILFYCTILSGDIGPLFWALLEVQVCTLAASRFRP